MAYFAPYIDETGLHIPTYRDIVNDIVEQAQTIYGQDIYLGNDSMDYQLIAIFAEKHYDVLQSVQAAYNNRGPSTAIGAGMDIVVAANGIHRKLASYSTCDLVLTGTAGAIIVGGIASDDNGTQWSFEDEVTIPDSGMITVRAKCKKLGAVMAAPYSIINIVTPTRGWISVANPEAAVLGEELETDAQLRSRQAISTARPSRAILYGTRGGIAELPGVTRSRVYENDTNQPDDYGHPGHSITCIVEGGDEMEIAMTIFNRKTTGGYTHGDVEIYLPPEFDQEKPIRFFRPRYVDIDIHIALHRITGYTTQVEMKIREYLEKYLNSLRIGDDLTVSSLWAVAMSATLNLHSPVFSIREMLVARAGEGLSPNDIMTDFDEVTRGDVERITIEYL